MRDLAEEIFISLLSSKSPKEVMALTSSNDRKDEIKKLAVFAIDAAAGYRALNIEPDLLG